MKNTKTSQGRTIVITFIGRIDDYKYARHYDQNNKLVCSSRYSAEYIVEKYQPDLMLLMYLDIEREATFDEAGNLIDLLKQKQVKFNEVALELAKNVKVPNNYDWNGLLWEMTKKIDRHVHEFHPDDTIYIDITHGFRTLPYMLMGVFRYLSVIKGVQNVKIVYGNLIDSGEVSDDYHHVYFEEIRSFDDLNRWTDATAAFVKYAQVQQIYDEIKYTRVEGLSKKLEELAKSMQAVTHALHLVQWVNYIPVFQALQKEIGKLLQGEQDKPIPYFVRYVIEWMQRELTPMFRWNDENNIEHHINIQREVLRWYTQNEMYTNALILAREFLLTRALMHGVVREEYHGKWEQSTFTKQKYVGKQVVKILSVERIGKSPECLKNDAIRRSGTYYVKAEKDTSAYVYDVSPRNLYPSKYTNKYADKNYIFGELVFDMRNDVGHGMGDKQLLRPVFIREVLQVIIDDDTVALPAKPTI